MRETFLLDLDKRIKDVHYFHGSWEEACIWSTVDVSSGTAQPWFACLHLSQEMSLEMNEQATVNTGLILSPEDWVAFLSCQSPFIVFFFPWAEIVDSSGLPGPVEIRSFLFFTVATSHWLTMRTHWKLLLLLWIFIWIKKMGFVLVVHMCPFHTYMLLQVFVSFSSDHWYTSLCYNEDMISDWTTLDAEKTQCY